MMNKENALEHISRWIDQRKKEGYEIASVGIKGMEEVHINLKKETPSFNDVDKNMSIVWNYFKDKKNKFDDVEIQAWEAKIDGNSIYNPYEEELCIFEQLINEHFKPKENTSEFKHFKLHSDSSLKNLTKVELIDYIKMLYHKPYKFEDLHEGMCVWDDIEKLICQIGLISKNAIHRKYIDGTISDSPFEENRFFPVQCANWNGSER